MITTMMKILKTNLEEINNGSLDKLNFKESSISLVMGYLSPDIDFHYASKILKANFNRDVKVVLTSTAGELCSLSNGESLPLYHEAIDNRGNIVLQSFSNSMIEGVTVHTIELFGNDLKHNFKVDKIKDEIIKANIPNYINYNNYVALTLIDGLSASESFYMEAVYKSGKLPCLSIGGSAGGHLDFKNTYIFNNDTVVQNKAVITLIKFRNNIRFGVFKSQNFSLTNTSFTIAEADENQRYVKSIIDKNDLTIKDFIAELCLAIGCDERELSSQLEAYSFAIKIDNEIYVRSISNIDLINRSVSFYCDLSFGDELYLVKHTDFVKSIENDFNSFMKNKPKEIIGGVFNDCILRRLYNSSELNSIKTFNDIPVAGFSTFGELLGVNINQTLTALILFNVTDGEDFYDDYVDDFVNKYSSFKEYFLRRTLNQQKQILLLKENIWSRSKKSIAVLSTLIKDLMNYVNSNVEHINSIQNSFTGLYNNIDSSKINGSTVSMELDRLGESASDIKDVLYNVVDIADRINLLGFNASIEAARAGVHGKGFAVVAGEVKKLADLTQKSVKDSNLSVSAVITGMEDIKERVKKITKDQDIAYTIGQDLNSNIDLISEESNEAHINLSRHLNDINSLMDEIELMDKTESCLKRST